MKRTMSLICVFLCVAWFVATPSAIAQIADGDTSRIDQRLKELADPKSNIPGTEFGIYSELGQLDKEIEEYQTLVVPAAIFDARLKKLADTIKEADDIFDALDKAKCETMSEAELTALKDKLQRLARKLNDIQFSFDIFDQENPLRNLPKTDAAMNVKIACETLIKLKDKRSEVAEYLGNAKKQLESQKNDPSREKASTLVAALKVRRDALRKKIGAEGTQQAISGNLAWIIAAIGLFSILTLGGVLAFDHDIQVEWVASGQVIQFVTVMIILSVILALGLSDILKENTIGTLLGGLAGYILSQGIGRAAAREAARAQNPGAAGATIAVTGLTPNTGPAAGGTVVTISGSGFAAGVSVSLGGTRVVPTNVTATSMQITTPAHAVGSVEVVVANPNGHNATLPGGFTYQA